MAAIASAGSPGPATDTQGLLLCHADAGERHGRLAICVAASLLLAFALTVPVVRRPLPAVPAFAAVYDAALAMLDLVTCVLLYAQYRQSGERSCLALACGYVFTPLLIAGHALSFPDAFGPGRVYGDAQTTAWLWMGWHGLFPGYVIAYALLARHERSRQAPPRFDLTLAPRWLLATLALAALTLVLAAQGEAWLPRLMFGNLYASPVTQAVLLLGWVAHLAAFMVLFRATRLRRLIDLWIGVMLIAMMIDLALSAVLISGRYQLGWYVGRAYGLLAAVFVLSVLLRETIALNRQAVEVAEWLRASEAQRRIVSDLVPDLLWTTDAQGRLAWHNERFLCYAGPVGLGNFDWRRLVCPDDLPRVIAAWQASLDSGAPFESEHRLQRVDGQWRWHLVRAEAWRTGDGEIRLWIGSATDVHEQRSALALLEQRVQERTAALEREAERRRTLLARVERLQDDERRRIARDLHDVLGQEIVALSLALDDAASALQQRPGSTGAALQRARERLAAVDRELDGIVFQLRPTALEDMGLADAIAAHAAQWGRHAGVAVDIASHGPVQERLPPHVEAAVFRAVQEALTNVARHAQARGVALLVERTRGRLQVAVEDDGVGFMPDATGAMRGQWGLLGMQERLAALGGEVQLESQPGRGTTVLMRVPL